MKIRTGIGYDVHPLVPGLPLRIGGVDVPSEKGAKGHSDADVLIHALCDALLGAAGLRDIGFHFPDSSSAYKGIDSRILLGKTLALVTEAGYRVENIDSVVCLQHPKIASLIPQMISELAGILNMESNCVSVKATTTEKLGFVGREEGIAAYATVLLIRD